MGVSLPYKWLVCGLSLAVPAALQASDYSYKETSQITGGSVVTMMKMAGAFSSQARKAGEPIVSNIYLKGNRLARVSPDRAEIIDLDKETVTNVDMVKRTYTVVTFEQMRQQMKKAMDSAPAQQQKQAPAPAQDPNSDVKMSFDVKVRNTGVQKQVSGLSTNEAILTMTMNATDQKTQQSGALGITNDMWMADTPPGYGDMREFHMKMAEKMGLTTAGVGLDLGRLRREPGREPALSDIGKEMQKLKGVPIDAGNAHGFDQQRSSATGSL